MKPASGLRSQPCLFPGTTIQTKKSRNSAIGFVGNLGPDVPLHFTAFHPDFKMLDLRPTPPETLVRARRRALTAGLHHVYVGNIHDPPNDSTYCASCRRLLIERDWYELGHYDLDESGCCKFCGARLAGHFDARPGRWGRCRLPLSLEG